MFAILKKFGMIALIPSLLQCMDQSDQQQLTRSTNSGTGSSHFTLVCNPLEPALQVQINEIYDYTASLIPKITKNDIPAISSFLSLVTNINTFKRNNPNITERYLGSFAYTKESGLATSVAERFSFIASPIHVSLFFKLLEEYNDSMQAYNKTHPTLDDWKSHIYNKTFPTKKALELGKHLGITIDKCQLRPDKPPFKCINPDVAIKSFSLLVKKTEKLMKLKPTDNFKFFAQLVYVNIHAPTENQTYS